MEKDRILGVIVLIFTAFVVVFAVVKEYTRCTGSCKAQYFHNKHLYVIAQKYIYPLFIFTTCCLQNIYTLSKKPVIYTRAF